MFPLLAQSPIPPETIWVGVVVVVLMGLAAALNHITATIDRFRAKPPAHDVYASKEEMDRLEVRIHGEITATDRRSEVRAQENRDLIQQKVTELERVLCDKITENKTNHTEHFGFLRGEMHAMRGSMQALSNEISRAVGRLEGAKQVAHE